MKHWAIRLAFFFGGLSLPARAYYALGVPEWIPYPELLLLLPAVVASLDALRRDHWLSRSPWVLCGVALVLLGVLWTETSERGRGALVAAQLAVAFGLGALVLERRAYRDAVNAYLAGTACLVLFVLVQSWRVGAVNLRLGGAYIPDLGYLVNANALGMHLTLAAVLALAMLPRAAPQAAASSAELATRWLPQNMAYLLTAAGLTGAVVLTASRGASATLAVTVLIFLVAGADNGRALLLRLVGFCGLLLIVAMFVHANDALLDRFRDNSSVNSLGGRLSIWEAGFEAATSSNGMLLWGAGTGGAERLLAEFAPGDPSCVTDEDGITRLSPHNAFLEWWMAFGIMGILWASAALVVAVHRARRFDRADGSQVRTILLVAYCLASLTIPVYRYYFAIPLHGFLLAALAAPMTSRVAPPQPRRAAAAREAAVPIAAVRRRRQAEIDRRMSRTP